MASRAATGRAIAIIAGLVLALIAAFLIWRYVNTADQRAQEGAELVDVFVASGGIPEGTTAQSAVSQNLIELDQVPTDVRPENAITSLEQISGLAATADIEPGSFIQQGQWGDPTIIDADFEVPEGLVAISLQVGIPEGLSGYLTQGDRVAVIAHIQAPPSTTSTTIGPDGNPVEETVEDAELDTTRAEFVARDGVVLTVGQRTIATNEEGTQEDEIQTDEALVLATVAVTPEDAEKLVFSSNEGLLHFALLPETGELPDTPGRTFDDLFQE
ncbi:Flp pilus assembly protein CpaB [Salsipaludibacter albus]|uniref:Flp pilus assembly protein CpaB n=1 Tax=Salsipaludibacter albus TaxID=2849650 RepID=UPI001EE461B0|nr:Flp pilus assembly protein CpaB [Salsipaludibacter albus]